MRSHTEKNVKIRNMKKITLYDKDLTVNDNIFISF